jgi:L-serine dehydratase
MHRLLPRISVFDMLKIGVGPSSSHTMGPWRAAERFLTSRQMDETFRRITRVRVDLYGSLAKTGKGHGTDMAVLMGLRGENPVTCDTSQIPVWLEEIENSHQICLMHERLVPFDSAQDLIFHYDKTLPFHPNALSFSAWTPDSDEPITEIYYSIGGGFVVQEGDVVSALESVTLPYPADNADEVRDHCADNRLALWEMVWENERSWRSDDEIRSGLLAIWDAMLNCMYRGCHTHGQLPGGLRVQRRAAQMHDQLIEAHNYANSAEWLAHLKAHHYTFPQMVRWVSCFALAVNEENAAFGRVVTAPTNGAAGVIPAVLMYTLCATDPPYGEEETIMRFLMVAGEIGSLFKKGATISAAMGGCQAEIGVSSAMAAAALTESLGGSVDQVLMAAEIAMEHHLGLTCDPVGGLVQVPCIERNAMGAMKAITAANIALTSDPAQARVSLDDVIKTMWQTALDMNDKYKETSEGGLALNIPVNVSEC